MVILSVVLQSGIASTLHITQRHRAVAGQGQRYLQGRQHGASIPVGQAHERRHRVGLSTRTFGREPPSHDLGQLLIRERLEAP